MIKLIITDLDGTFLNNSGEYDRDYFAGVRELMARKGVHFAACTGKQCERVEELFGSHSQDMWIVGDSATRIRRNGEFVYESLLNNALGLRIIRTLEQANPAHVIIACTPQGAVIRTGLDPALKDKVRRSYARVTEVADYAEIENDFVKITVFDEAGTCPQTRPHLTPYEDEAYIVVSEPQWIDIANYGVHKGATVRHLQEMLGIGPHETMAFGDGHNDIELLAEAEYSFAMRNAFDETKAVARFITGYNDQSAVQKTIAAMLALQP